MLYDQSPEHVRQLYNVNYGYLVGVRVRVRVRHKVRVRVMVRLGIGLGLGFPTGQSQCVPPFRNLYQPHLWLLHSSAGCLCLSTAGAAKATVTSRRRFYDEFL